MHEVEVADLEAAQKAIRQGRPLPAPKVEQAQDELEALERELELVAELLPTSARELLAAAVEVATDVSARADEVADELELRALDTLREVEQMLVAANASRFESAWADEAATDGQVHPWRSGGAPGAGAGAIAEAARAVEAERERRAERAAEYEAEARALNVTRRGDVLVELPPPPDRESAAAESA